MEAQYQSQYESQSQYQTQTNNKIIILKKKFEKYGFNEPFNEDNYELVNHIINNFNKILFSFQTINK